MMYAAHVSLQSLGDCLSPLRKHAVSVKKPAQAFQRYGQASDAQPWMNPTEVLSSQLHPMLTSRQQTLESPTMTDVFTANHPYEHALHKHLPSGVSPEAMRLLHSLDQEKNIAFTLESNVNAVFRALHPAKNGVVVYASGKYPKDPQMKQLAHDIGATLAHIQNRRGQTFHIITGGTPHAKSLMEYVAKGASEQGGHVVGVDLGRAVLTPEVTTHTHAGRKLFPEVYLPPKEATQELREGKQRLPRATMRSAYTVALPGGPGTVMEIMRKAVELHENKTPYPAQKQIILVDYQQYYSRPGGFMAHMHHLVKEGMVSKPFLEMFTLVNTPMEVAHAIQNTKRPWTPGVLPHDVTEPLRNTLHLNA
ncbi:MAG: LOG family protein [Vampirovibrionales bacterium]